MKNTIIASALVTLFFPSLSGGDEFRPEETEHIRFFDVAYRAKLGKRVIVDALVWHYLGTSGRGGSEIITPTGQVIFVSDAYERVGRVGREAQFLPQGKLVRIVGILEFGPGPISSGLVMATGDKRSHLNLAMESFELIETAEFPWPRMAPKNSDAKAGNADSEQGGAEQPATAPESEPVDNRNLNPDSEDRSQ